MEIDKKDFNPELHAQYHCICVPQPKADRMTNIDWQDGEGNFHAAQEIDIRTRKTNYRGDVLICSSARPQIAGRMSGVTCGLVELYDCKPIEELTEQEWENAFVEKKPAKGYAWFFRDPRRVVEFDIKGRLGIYTICLPKDDIQPYPRVLQIEESDWELLNKRIERLKNEGTKSE